MHFGRMLLPRNIAANVPDNAHTTAVPSKV